MSLESYLAKSRFLRFYRANGLGAIGEKVPHVCATKSQLFDEWYIRSRYQRCSTRVATIARRTKESSRNIRRHAYLLEASHWLVKATEKPKTNQA